MHKPAAASGLQALCLLVLVGVQPAGFSAPCGGGGEPDLALAESARLARDYLDRVPTQAIAAPLSIADAYAVQCRFVERLRQQAGAVSGYKAALTSPGMQARFGVNHPVRGALLAGMLLQSGSRISVHFGTRALIEADILVRVGDPRINTAATSAEIAAAVDAIVPFIELPDLVYDGDVRPRAVDLIAINAGARLGIVGAPVSVAGDATWAARLPELRVVVTDETGTVLARGDGRSALTDPIAVITWLRDSLRASGQTLKSGDVLSLGALTAPLPLVEGTPFPGPPVTANLIRVTYSGLDASGPSAITVEFDRD